MKHRGPTLDLFDDEVPHSVKARTASIRRVRDGMATAEANAERKFSGWQSMAAKFVLAYGKIHATFLAEDCRHWAAKRGLPEPPSKRAWGPLMLKMEKLGLVDRVGMGRGADSGQAHVVLWRTTGGT